MIISHQHRFIFIKTVKTAGTSIEIFLSQQCGPSDVVTPIFPHVEPHVARNHAGFYHHMSAFEIRSRVAPEIWRTYFKFCVERNPWDKTLSHYHMENHRQGGRLELKDYLAKKSFPVNFPAYTHPHNLTKLIVDQVVRYENLIPELDGVFRRLGIEFAGSLGVHAKSEYRSDRRPYQEVFSNKQAKLVRDAFRPEIALHGYTY